jgi:Tfp pilus assembly protein PilN
MIRINLLGVARRAAKPPGPPPTAARQAVIFVASLLVAFGVVGFMYRYWTSQIADLNKKLVDEKREADRLAGIRAENQRYLAQQQQLERRTNTIQMLEASRVGPTDFMTTLGALVNRTNDLYLLTITPAGDRTVIQGQSNSVESIATFVAALKNSGNFVDVQLRQYFQDDQQNRLNFKFSIDCVYKTPSAAPPVAPPGAAPAAPARQAGM